MEKQGLSELETVQSNARQQQTWNIYGKKHKYFSFAKESIQVGEFAGYKARKVDLTQNV